jgi:hypothetical protein
MGGGGNDGCVCVCVCLCLCLCVCLCAEAGGQAPNSCQAGCRVHNLSFSCILRSLALCHSCRTHKHTRRHTHTHTHTHTHKHTYTHTHTHSWRAQQLLALSISFSFLPLSTLVLSPALFFHDILLFVTLSFVTSHTGVHITFSIILTLGSTCCLMHDNTLFAKWYTLFLSPLLPPSLVYPPECMYVCICMPVYRRVCVCVTARERSRVCNSNSIEGLIE